MDMNDLAEAFEKQRQELEAAFQRVVDDATKRLEPLRKELITAQNNAIERAKELREQTRPTVTKLRAANPRVAAVTRGPPTIDVETVTVIWGKRPNCQCSIYKFGIVAN